MAKKTVGYEGNTNTGKGEWLTPKSIIDCFPPFDLDPFAPVGRPWDTAERHYTILDDGFTQPWGVGRVFCNPPYSEKELKRAFALCHNHGNAIGLCFNRTETTWFRDLVWKRADALLFKYQRINFCNVDGTPGAIGSGAGSVFVAWGLENAYLLEKLSQTTIPGQFMRLR